MHTFDQSSSSGGDSAARSRRATAIVIVAVVAWSIFSFWVLRPSIAVTDLQGWRQADTQTIAINMAKPGASIFYPAVAWGGDGPGYAETELQVYTVLVAWLMNAFGPGEWAGQAVSSVAMLGAALVLFFDLRRRHGFVPGALALTAFLGVRSIVHLATSIQPDALSLLAYALAWSWFVRYRDLGKSRDLVLHSLALGFAMLVKPTAAQLGLSCALLALLTNRELFRRRALWVAWAVPLVVLAAYLWHAHNVWAQYGNSFGLFKGGNEKVPTWGELLSPFLLYKVARLMFVWGVGYAGTVALVVLAIRRRYTPEIWALAAGNVFMCVAFIRITATMAGSHYVAPAALLGAEAICVLWPLLAASARADGKLNRLAMQLAAVFVAAQPVITARYRLRMSEVDPGAQIVYQTGLALRPLVKPGELVIVRSKVYDPRIFYIASVRGWLANWDDPGVGQVPERARRGHVRYVIDPMPAQEPTELDAWLAAHGRQVQPPGVGRIWLLRDAGEPTAAL